MTDNAIHLLAFLLLRRALAKPRYPEAIQKRLVKRVESLIKRYKDPHHAESEY